MYDLANGKALHKTIVSYEKRLEYAEHFPALGDSSQPTSEKQDDASPSQVHLYEDLLTDHLSQQGAQCVVFWCRHVEHEKSIMQAVRPAT